jgi:protein-tyrosine-phosphatase
MIPSLWKRVKRRLVRAYQHRRMAQAASQPHDLAMRVAQARTILFVCHGNIIRSAFAAELMRARNRTPGDVRVLSAGLEAGLNGPAHPTAVDCARRFGIDLSGHRTHRLGLSDTQEADVLLAMEVDHVLEIRRRFPECRHKVYLFGCFTDEQPLEVADPVCLPRDAFVACFERIDRGVRRIIEMLPAQSRVGAPAREVES